MVQSHVRSIFYRVNSLKIANNDNNVRRCISRTTRSGAILPEPKTQRFGLVGVIGCTVLGLTIGTTISKYIANFLEENDLFVPSDDDDDDD